MTLRKRFRCVTPAEPADPVARCPHGLPVTFLDPSKLNPVCGDCRRAENHDAATEPDREDAR